MEIGVREGVQFISIAVALAGAFAVCKNQLSRVIYDLKKASLLITALENRVDSIEAARAVFQQQIAVLGDINSPRSRELLHRELAANAAHITNLAARVAEIQRQHNGAHPRVPKG